MTIAPGGRRRERFDRLVAEGSPFRKNMTELGATDADSLTKDQIIIYFGDSKLDITIADATPPGGERPATVQGLTAIVLATTQVLSGKLARSHDLLARDAFDIKTATRKAPKSLAWAVNRVPPENMEAIVNAWTNTSGRWAAVATSELKDVADKYSYDPGLLGRETAEALRNARYRTVEIETHGRTGRFTAETIGGTPIGIPFTRRTLDSIFDEFGIRDYLDEHEPGFDDDAIRDIRRSCRLGHRRTTVYKTTHRVMPAKTPDHSPFEEPAGSQAGGDGRRSEHIAMRGTSLGRRSTGTTRSTGKGYEL